MNILLTNDDGINADGFQSLERMIKKGNEVYVSAPDVNRSCTGHSMTLRKKIPYEKKGEWRYSVGGLPVDCVAAALSGFFTDISMDFTLSGINHGANLGTDIFYSGTFSAALRSAEDGIDSMALSVNRYEPPFVTPAVEKAITAIVGQYAHRREVIRERGLSYIHTHMPSLRGMRYERPALCLNVNFPDPVAWREFDGISGALLSRRIYDDKIAFFEEGGVTSFEISGHVADVTHTAATDNYLVDNGFVSVSPFFYFFPGMLLLIPESVEGLFSIS